MTCTVPRESTVQTFSFEWSILSTVIFTYTQHRYFRDTNENLLNLYSKLRLTEALTYFPLSLLELTDA